LSYKDVLINRKKAKRMIKMIKFLAGGIVLSLVIGASVLAQSPPAPIPEISLGEKAWSLTEKVIDNIIDNTDGIYGTDLLAETRDERLIPILTNIVLSPTRNSSTKRASIKILEKLAVDGIDTNTIITVLEKTLQLYPYRESSEEAAIGFDAADALCVLKNKQGRDYMRGLLHGLIYRSPWYDHAALPLARGEDYSEVSRLKRNLERSISVGGISEAERYAGEIAEVVFKSGDNNVKKQVEDYIARTVEKERENPNIGSGFLDSYMLVLGRMSKERISPILKKLTMNPSDNVPDSRIEYHKRIAIEALGESQNKEAIDIIKKGINDAVGDDWVKFASAVALHKLDDITGTAQGFALAEERLNQIIPNENNESTYYLIAETLGEMGGEQANRLLINKYFLEKDMPLRALNKAIDSMGKIGTVSELQYLEKLLGHQDRWVKLHSALAILRISNKNKTYPAKIEPRKSK
jgi:hypothetical protein